MKSVKKKQEKLLPSAPYVRVLQLGPTGRVVKKKKTGAERDRRAQYRREAQQRAKDLQAELDAELEAEESGDDNRVDEDHGFE